MITIGLTGSIATGKTETARMFAELGLPVLDSDAVVHRVYSRRGAAVAHIEKLVPEAIMDGAVNREAMAMALAADPALLAKVEAIVHPIVWAEQVKFLAQAREQGAPIAVLDIPLLYEKRRESSVDKIVVASCPPDMQRARALARPGMTVEKLNWILDRQLPDAEKRERADFIVETGGGLEAARAQVSAIVARLSGKEPNA